MVQWLRLQLPMQGACVRFLMGKLRSHVSVCTLKLKIPQATMKTADLYVAAKTQHSQINK